MRQKDIVSVRVLDTRTYSGNSAPKRTCKVRGCKEGTREGKPYCPAHVDRHPYVRNLINGLSTREDQDERVRREGSKAVELDGITVHEMLLALELHGPRTQERLTRELNLEIEVISSYAKRLKREGIVTLGRTVRGATVVRLRKPRQAQNQDHSAA